MQGQALNLALLVLRLGLASIFLYHGSQKLFGWFGGSGLASFAEDLARLGLPVSSLAALLASLAQLIGGLSLLMGWCTRHLLVPLAFTMFVATVVDGRPGFGSRMADVSFHSFAYARFLRRGFLVRVHFLFPG